MAGLRLPALLLAALLATGGTLVGGDPQPAPLPSDDAVIVPEQPLELRIEAPDTINAGELLVLDAGDSAATNFRWTLVNDDRPNARFRLANGDRTLFFATPTPGRYVFVVAASTPRQLVLEKITVVVAGVEPPAPGPGPGPTPNPQPPQPPPGPVVPDGRLGLTRKTYDLAKPLAEAYGPLLREVAGNYDSVASEAGGLSSATVASMRAQITERNRATAGTNREALIAPFFGPLGQAIGELERAGKVGTKADCIGAFNEIAAGLRLAAGGVQR